MFKSEVTDTKVILTVFGIKLTFKKPFRIKNNKILLCDKNGNERKVNKIKGLKIVFKGQNAVIRVKEPYKFNHCQILLGDDCSASFGKNVELRNVDIRAVAKNSVLEIGDALSWGGGGNIFMSPNPDTKVIVGNNCLFADHLYISTSDGHKIYAKDDAEQKAINMGGDIIIGNHVWLARYTTVLKNSKIADNCVVGANSLINKKYEEENIVLAGQPAKKVKENINWNINF